jgi:hypothetical protein
MPYDEGLADRRRVKESRGRQTGESETSSPAPDFLSNPLKCYLNGSANSVTHW